MWGTFCMVLVKLVLLCDVCAWWFSQPKPGGAIRDNYVAGTNHECSTTSLQIEATKIEFGGTKMGFKPLKMDRWRGPG